MGRLTQSKSQNDSIRGLAAPHPAPMTRCQRKGAFALHPCPHLALALHRIGIALPQYPASPTADL
jgi:hypothetical protein